MSEVDEVDAEGALLKAKVLRDELGEILRANRRVNVDLQERVPSNINVGGYDGQHDRVRRILDELEHALEAAGIEGRPPALRTDEMWTTGRLTITSGQLEPIYGGYLEPVLVLPIAPPVSDLVVYFLTIPGEDDLLKREQHSHFGWHYHYLNWKEERSDRILCWDMRAAVDKMNPRPLFHEKHAEGGGFPARPGRWGPRKKESMYLACKPDLTTRAGDKFKQASNGAEVVWPMGRVLTPRKKT